MTDDLRALAEQIVNSTAEWRYIVGVTEREQRFAQGYLALLTSLEAAERRAERAEAENIVLRGEWLVNTPTPSRKIHYCHCHNWRHDECPNIQVASVATTLRSLEGLEEKPND